MIVLILLTPVVVQTDAMDVLGCLDFSACSSCVRSADASAAFVRISIGEFMASQSEALGSLDGSQCTVRVSS